MAFGWLSFFFQISGLLTYELLTGVTEGSAFSSFTGSEKRITLLMLKWIKYYIVGDTTTIYKYIGYIGSKNLHKMSRKS